MKIKLIFLIFLLVESSRWTKSEHFNGKKFEKLRSLSENYAFESDTKRLMEIVVQSLYRDREVFLRELISNGVDATERIRYSEKENFSIRIEIDRKNRILNVVDFGVGMTKKDLTEKLGTISKSNFEEFSMKNENSSIGKFGIGFYSAFLVADRIVVSSKNDEDQRQIWESDGSTFRIFPDLRSNFSGRGTTVSLYLKKDAEEFLDPSTVVKIVEKFSQLISLKIFVKVLNENISEILVNSGQPIWRRKKFEIEEEEYKTFFRFLTRRNEEPIVFSHFSVQGEINFQSILYVARRPSSKIFLSRKEKSRSLKFYSRSVFVTDQFEQILPKYLTFVDGVVDCEDFSINLERENFLESSLIEKIREKLIEKTFELLRKIHDKIYPKFWDEYGTNIKLGVIEDVRHRTALAEFIRFRSSFSKENFLSLDEYFRRMKKQQKNIYFLMSRSQTEAERSPFIEKAVELKYEILYLLDPIDEYSILALENYRGKKFLNLAKDNFEIEPFDFESQNERKSLETNFQPMIDWMKIKFNETIENVVLSQRLVKSSMVLLAGRFGYDGNLERLARVYLYSKMEKDSAMEFYFQQKKILEINPKNILIKDFLRRIKSKKEFSSILSIDEYATILFELGTIRSNFDLKNSIDFVDRLELIFERIFLEQNSSIEERPLF